MDEGTTSTFLCRPSSWSSGKNLLRFPLISSSSQCTPLEKPSGVEQKDVPMLPSYITVIDLEKGARPGLFWKNAALLSDSCQQSTDSVPLLSYSPPLIISSFIRRKSHIFSARCLTPLAPVTSRSFCVSSACGCRGPTSKTDHHVVRLLWGRGPCRR